MPQQSKTKRTKNKKLSKMPFVYIAILLIAVVITVCLVVRNNQSKEGREDKAQTEGSQTENAEEPMILPEQTLIDMNNTENAKVEEGVKENTSSKLAEPKTYKGLTLSNIKLKAEGGITRLTATVENNSSQDYEGEEIVIVFTNSDGSEYARLNGILPSIKVGDTNELDAATTSDVANAYNFTVEKDNGQ